MNKLPEIYNSIVETYLDTGSVQETAEKLETTPVKVRKVLITEGLWSSRTSLEVQHYLNLGKTTEEIAQILCTTDKAVQQYIPYTKGMYKAGEPSVAAINSADYRERIKIAKEKTLRQNIALAVENQWYEMYETPGMKYLRENGIGMEPHKRDFYPGTLELPDDTDYTQFHRMTYGPRRLHLELVRSDGYNGESRQRGTDILKKYGDVNYGDTISRDVVVPGAMPLWALNYVIQKCFGWENSHLHSFELPEEHFSTITDNKFENYVELVGVAFRSPWMDENEEFWADDYESGSFKTWLRKKYTGPYDSMCHGEGIWQCKQDMYRMEKRYDYVEVEHCFRKDGFEYYENLKPISCEEYNRRVDQPPVETNETNRWGLRARVIKEVYAFEDIPMSAANRMSERPLNQLLERQTIGNVLSMRNKGLNDHVAIGNQLYKSFEELMDSDLEWEIEEYSAVDEPNMQPIVGPLTDVLLYRYDFGDGWKVKITGSLGAADLVENGRVTQEELEDAARVVYSKFRPVCIAWDGYPVLDDVGGISGYIDFLEGINGNGEVGGLYEDAKESLAWAKSLGWSTRNISNKNLL